MNSNGKQTTTAALAGVLVGVALGCAVAVFEPDAYIPRLGVAAGLVSLALVGIACVVALSGRYMRAAWILLVTGVTLYAAFFTVMTVIRK